MSLPLTEKQRRVLDFIASQTRKTGLPPTVREIAKHFSVFPKAVQDHVTALVEKGALHRIKERARGLVVAAAQGVASGGVPLPILGRVPAGMPMEAVTQTDDYFSVDEAIAKKANFALRVKGDSMYPTLWDGDLVLVQFTPSAENGEIVVASVGGDDDATVKKLRKTPREVYLEAINPAYPPIHDPDIAVIGRVTSLIRPFFKV
jgi:repressor LexA